MMHQSFNWFVLMLDKDRSVSQINLFVLIPIFQDDSNMTRKNDPAFKDGSDAKSSGSSILLVGIHNNLRYFEYINVSTKQFHLLSASIISPNSEEIIHECSRNL